MARYIKDPEVENENLIISLKIKQQMGEGTSRFKEVSCK